MMHLVTARLTFYGLHCHLHHHKWYDTISIRIVDNVWGAFSCGIVLSYSYEHMKTL